MPIQFPPLRNKSPLEVLSAIPGPASIGGDVEGILKLLAEAPKEYQQDLLLTQYPKIGRLLSPEIERNVQEMLGGFGKGSAGISKHPIEGAGEEGENIISRNIEGDPLGYASILNKIVRGLATNPESSPIERSKTLIELAKEIIKQRALPEDLTQAGEKALNTLRRLSKITKGPRE